MMMMIMIMMMLIFYYLKIKLLDYRGTDGWVPLIILNCTIFLFSPSNVFLGIYL